MESNKKINEEILVLGGGCFWCTEAVFKMIKGVNSVLPGYAGGTKDKPTYEEVCSGSTGHAEVVYLKYDPSIVKIDDLLTIFFGSHDPTTLNQQGDDKGTQYRSVIFYTTENQKEISEKFIKGLNNSDTHGAPIVTEVRPLDKFYEAEHHHKNYYAQNPGSLYCKMIINPKLQKVQKKFANLLKNIKK